MILTTISN